MRVLVTGATGFIGQFLVKELINKNFNISIVVRKKTNIFSDKVKQFVVEDFESHPDFQASLENIDCIIHLAAKAHLVDKSKSLVPDEFRNINTKLTLHLANQAVTAKVKRFVFLSSIGVNGNQNNQSFSETDKPNPQDPYAISKYEAELGLLKIAQNSSLDAVIIRSPLVYGKNAPGNFGRLIQWASAKFIIPLPLGAVNNARSLIAIDNLVSFITVCTLHPKSANEIFLIADNETISTTQLLKNIAKVFNKKVLFFPVPSSWIIFVGKILGKEDDIVRLFSSLTIDSSKARDLLDWQPVITMNEQLYKIKENEKSI